MRKPKLADYMSDLELIEQLKELPLSSPLRMLTVKVTNDDCHDEARGHPTKCAVSTALRRILPKATYACTKHNGVTITINSYYCHFAQSNKGSHTIDDFDQRRFKPTALMLQLTDIRAVQKASSERKEQINEARRKRASEGRPDKTYKGDPLRMRMAKSADVAA
jgi:hypothetical protein